MSHSWEIPFDGGLRHLTIERAENGKDVIRLDGRTAAKPLDPTEDSRPLLIDGDTWLVRRSGDGFELELLTPALAPPPPTAPAKLTGGIEALGYQIRFSSLFWLVVIAIVAAFVYFLLGPSYPRQAEQRVELLLREMARGPGQEELAIGIWARNTRTLDTTELAWAVGAYPRFLYEKNLRRTFSDWKVLDSDEVDVKKPRTAIVRIAVEGVEMKMLVPERLPIKWAE